MKHGQYDDALRLDTVEHGIRETTCPDTANVTQDDGATQRILRCQLYGAIDLDNKLRPETGATFPVP